MSDSEWIWESSLSCLSNSDESESCFILSVIGDEESYSAEVLRIVDWWENDKTIKDI